MYPCINTQRFSRTNDINSHEHNSSVPIIANLTSMKTRDINANIIYGKNSRGDEHVVKRNTSQMMSMHCAKGSLTIPKVHYLQYSPLSLIIMAKIKTPSW